MRLNKHILIRECIIRQQCCTTEERRVCRESNWPFPMRVPIISSHSYSLINFLLSSTVKVCKDFLVKQWMPEHLACRMLSLVIVGGWGRGCTCIWHVNNYFFWRAVLGRSNGSPNAVSLAVASKPQKQLIPEGSSECPLIPLAPKHPHILPFCSSRKPKLKKVG